ncbi:MAG: hypothetical protein UV59_C0006G0072 [Candidatus Gottesmanbacteria bacterium GW2011_GWA1_43_11]|uniref:Uncharacterized protein n=1 Tax=Candidatus Gottesmanbacteria bacterium GW2011_GWA1_43_11 TaxID=1618436 RepID=A0A0G1ERD8_9BACT|nr:MAG: hypothetical protein UV59_C0006G0072 [Candidatus Gottesmanbacteria bacterium GW2011_GWA1_43_11]
MNFTQGSGTMILLLGVLVVAVVFLVLATRK